MPRREGRHEIEGVFMAVDSSLFGLNKIEHIGHYGQQHSLTLHMVVVSHTGLRVECYGI